MADKVPNATNPNPSVLQKETIVIDGNLKNAKLAGTHTHTIAQVTGLQTALDSKQPKA